jgi:hypothetical protein
MLDDVETDCGHAEPWSPNRPFWLLSEQPEDMSRCRVRCPGAEPALAAPPTLSTRAARVGAAIAVGARGWHRAWHHVSLTTDLLASHPRTDSGWRPVGCLSRPQGHRGLRWDRVGLTGGCVTDPTSTRCRVARRSSERPFPSDRTAGRRPSRERQKRSRNYRFVPRGDPGALGVFADQIAEAGAVRSAFRGVRRGRRRARSRRSPTRKAIAGPARPPCAGLSLKTVARHRPRTRAVRESLPDDPARETPCRPRRYDRGIPRRAQRRDIPPCRPPAVQSSARPRCRLRPTSAGDCGTRRGVNDQCASNTRQSLLAPRSRQREAVL